MTVSPNTPSERDFELLSAYLDNMLTERERQTLEQRLAEDTALRAALHDLRETVALLRNLPRLKAPRSFALDPAALRPQTPWWKRLFGTGPVLQTLGAAGGIASVVLIAVGLLVSRDTASLVTERQEAAGPESLSAETAVAAAPLTHTPRPSATLLSTLIPMTLDDEDLAGEEQVLGAASADVAEEYEAPLQPEPTLLSTISTPTGASSEKLTSETPASVAVMEQPSAAIMPTATRLWAEATTETAYTDLPVPSAQESTGGIGAAPGANEPGAGAPQPYPSEAPQPSVEGEAASDAALFAGQGDFSFAATITVSPTLSAPPAVQAPIEQAQVAQAETGAVADGMLEGDTLPRDEQSQPSDEGNGVQMSETGEDAHKTLPETKEASSERDLRWLAVVGAGTLVLSASVFAAGWQKKRRV